MRKKRIKKSNIIKTKNKKNNRIIEIKNNREKENGLKNGSKEWIDISIKAYKK